MNAAPQLKGAPGPVTLPIGNRAQGVSFAPRVLRVPLASSSSQGRQRDKEGGGAFL